MTYREMRRRDRQPRWATRQEAMAYGRIGSTKFNEMMQSRRIVAKKDGNKVTVDLNSRRLLRRPAASRRGQDQTSIGARMKAGETGARVGVGLTGEEFFEEIDTRVEARAQWQ